MATDPASRGTIARVSWTASDARAAAAAAHSATDQWREQVTRLEGELDGTSDELAPLVRMNLDHAKAMVNQSEDWAKKMDAEVERLTPGGEEDGGGESEGSGQVTDSPPTNPADQIGNAVEEVEAATAEVAETVAEQGNPEVAEALEEEVAHRLDAATEQVAAAADTVEAVAEAQEQVTPADTPEGEAATQAVEAAQEAEEAVEEAEEAVAEVTRVPEVRPDQEHWYYRSRFRRRKAKADG